MVRFYRRLRTDKLPLLLPVLDGFMETIPNADLIGPILEDHAYADITSHRFADGLTAMLGRIQQAVKQCELSKSQMVPRNTTSRKILSEPRSGEPSWEGAAYENIP